jgi:capsular polysaccharide biosynthesis protein
MTKEQMMEPRNNEELEIDLKELFYVLLDKIWIIILVGILMATGAGLVSKLLLKPIYTSSTSIYVINRQSEDKTTLSDLQTGTQLTKDYKILVKSRPVTEQVISELNLTMTSEDLAETITVNTPTDTRILEIVVENPDAYIAKQIADTIAEVSSERMVSVMEMEKVNIIEPGNLPTEPSSPNITRNMIIGGILGVLLIGFIVILVHILNDSIKSPDDIERYLGLTTLGTIPMLEGTTKKKQKIKQNSVKNKRRLRKPVTVN